MKAQFESVESIYCQVQFFALNTKKSGTPTFCFFALQGDVGGCVPIILSGLVFFLALQISACFYLHYAHGRRETL